MQKFRPLSVLFGVLLCSCAETYHEPDLGGLYNRAIEGSEEFRNPVIVIPGILGSRLVDERTGQVVWGAFRGDFADPETPAGARLIAVPMREGVPLAEITDPVRPAGALDVLRVSVLGLPIELGAYVNILSTLGAGGYRDEQLGRAGAIHYTDAHFTCFQFDYDWRRDIAENARHLAEFVREKRAYVREQHRKRYGRERGDVKFDIVAHSMGGLVTRYYLQYGSAAIAEDGSLPPLTWEGAQSVEKVVLVGTPNAGAVDALIQLVDGIQFAPLFPKYEPALLGTMPAIYELLPRSRHGHVVDAADPSRKIENLYDPALWERMGWGLASPNQEHVLEMLIPSVSDPQVRRRIALEHQRKSLRRAELLAAALDRPAPLPYGLTLRLIAGDSTPTNSILAVDSGDGSVRVIAKGPGDGSVLRSSALMDERTGAVWAPRLMSPVDWSHVSFIFRDHLGMTKDPMFTDNLLYFLLEEPT